MEQTPHSDSDLDRSEASPSDGAAPSVPFFTRLGWLFFSPGKLGEAIRERPTALVPALVGLALTITATLLVPQEIMMETFRAQALERGQDASAFSEETMGLFRLASVGGILIFWWVILAAGAGIYTVIFAFVLGDEARFKQFFSAVAWASVIAGLGGLCLTPLRIAARNPQLTLSPGTFLGTMMDEGFLLRLTSGLDFFALWSWIVTGILIAQFDRRRSTGSAVGVVVFVGVSIIAVFAALNFGG